MKGQLRWLAGAAVVTLAVVSALTIGSRLVYGQADHVGWAIISINFPTTTFSPGGEAFASAISGSAPSGLKIKFTGSGTFVAPASGGGSGAVDGGGTWTTSGGSGTYEVTALVSWERANDQANVGFVDNIDEGTRTNGTAVLKLAFSDGSSGVLTVGCHGPGAPPGIFEGIATTKGYKTYYNVPAPVSGVDAGRTIFHVR